MAKEPPGPTAEETIAAGQTEMQFADASDDQSAAPPEALPEAASGPAPDPGPVVEETTSATETTETLPADTADAVPSEDVGESQDPQDVEFPSDLLAETGYSAEQALSEFGSPEAMEQAMAFHDRQMMAAGRASSQQPPLPPQQQQVPQQQQQPSFQQEATAQQQAQQQQQQAALEAFKVKDTEAYDESTLALINEMSAHHLAQNQQLAAQNAQLSSNVDLIHQEMARRQEEAVFAEFDHMVDRLGDDYSETFGKARPPNGSPQFVARSNLFNSMVEMQRGRSSNGHPALAMEDLAKRTLRVEFPKQNDAAVRRQVNGKVQKRQSQHISRPTSRRGAPPSGVEAAVVVADQYYAQKLGLSPAMAGPVDDEI